jgi:ATP-dependent Lon protease
MEDKKDEKIIDEILQTIEEIKEKRELSLFETFIYYFFRVQSFNSSENSFLDEMLSFSSSTSSEPEDPLEKEENQLKNDKWWEEIPEEMKKYVDKKRIDKIINKYFEKKEFIPKVGREIILSKIEKICTSSSASSSEEANRFSWLEDVLDLPWENSSDSEISIEELKENLEKNIYALKSVKEKILRYFSLRKYSKDGKVLFFVGPPGTGKTYCAKEIAKSLKKPFGYLNLSGITSEVDLIGTQEVWVSSHYGEILKTFKNTNSFSPLMFLDEIDKMSHNKNIGANPEMILLDLFDTTIETFEDKWLGFPIKKSNLFFIVAGNTSSNLNPALLDRLEVIEFPPLTSEEKFQITKNFIIPSFKDLPIENLEIEDSALQKIIKNFKGESMRSVKKAIQNIVEAYLYEREIKKVEKIIIDDKNLNEYLNLAEVELHKMDQIGKGAGLSVYNYGNGDISIINVSYDEEAKESLTILGEAGSVLKNSAIVSLNVFKNYLKEKELKELKGGFIVEIEDISTPLDGPSAGLLLSLLFFSSFHKIPFSSKIAISGQVNLRGEVLPVGSVKAKAIAGKEEGFELLIFPYGNKEELKEFDGIKIAYVKTFEEAIPLVFNNIMSQSPHQNCSIKEGKNERVFL